MKQILSVWCSILIFLLIGVGYYHSVSAINQDLGRHLLLGKYILTHHVVPPTNLFSYTYPAFPFLNHHYLSEVLFYLIFVTSGYHGLLLLTTVTMLLTWGFLFFFSWKRVSPLALILASSLLLPVLFERTEIRPEIMSFLFVSLFVTILFINRERTTRWLYLLPFLSLLWVNMHIYFFVGIILLLAFLSDSLLTARFRVNFQTKRLFFVFLLSLFATILNPHGLTGALYPLHTFQNYGYTIEENQTFFLLERLGFQKPSVPFLKVTLISTILLSLVGLKRMRPIDWLLLSIGVLAGVSAVRNFPLVALILLYPFSYLLTEVAQPFLKKLLLFRTPAWENLLFLLLSVFLLWQLFATAKMKPPGFSVDEKARPAVNFFLNNNLHGPLFNNFDIGSYLIFRLYPRERVFVDGRPEAYPSSFFADTYIPMQQQPKLFERIDKQYGFHTIFFSHTDQTPWAQQFLQSITQNPSWKIVYLDSFSIILMKDIPENRSLLQKYRLTQEALVKKIEQERAIQPLLQWARFFSIVGWQDLEETTYKKILRLDPSACPALYNLSLLARQKNREEAEIFAFQYQTRCSK